MNQCLVPPKIGVFVESTQGAYCTAMPMAHSKSVCWGSKEARDVRVEPRGKVGTDAREPTDEEEQQGDRGHRGQRHDPHVAARHGGLPIRHPQERPCCNSRGSSESWRTP